MNVTFLFLRLKILYISFRILIRTHWTSKPFILPFNKDSLVNNLLFYTKMQYLLHLTKICTQ